MFVLYISIYFNAQNIIRNQIYLKIEDVDKFYIFLVTRKYKYDGGSSSLKPVLLLKISESRRAQHTHGCLSILCVFVGACVYYEFYIHIM